MEDNEAVIKDKKLVLWIRRDKCLGLTLNIVKPIRMMWINKMNFKDDSRTRSGWSRLGQRIIE
jgi:hypothetical protein